MIMLNKCTILGIMNHRGLCLEFVRMLQEGNHWEWQGKRLVLILKEIRMGAEMANLNRRLIMG